MSFPAAISNGQRTGVGSLGSNQIATGFGHDTSRGTPRHRNRIGHSAIAADQGRTGPQRNVAPDVGTELKRDARCVFVRHV